MNIEAMEKRVYKLMKENNIFGEVVNYNSSIKMIAIEITWGDWKHEHLRMDLLMQKEFSNLQSIFKQTTEEDGSDCYSAIHHYYFS